MSATVNSAAAAAVQSLLVEMYFGGVASLNVWVGRGQRGGIVRMVGSGWVVGGEEVHIHA